ncbi:MAG TPA: 2-hydroxychromene-2-carboxylate isomerase [Geminicoccaceae bacterium]|nr:2-hydroxychromene-2-carboxylate isomerase [Geminicoccaceae bacterium]
MAVIVDFFYGVGSRYSYLASTQLPSIEEETGCRFRWRPLFSGDLIALRGASPFQGHPVSGQYEWPYRQRDAEEWAALYGVPFREPPEELKGEEVPRRLALACTAAARLDAVEAYTRRLFRAVFADDRPSLGEEELGAYAVEVGLDRDRFLGELRDPAARDALRATTEEAFRRGAFGVPTFLAGDRLYWGNDRLLLLKRHLRSLPSRAGHTDVVR